MAVLTTPLISSAMSTTVAKMLGMNVKDFNLLSKAFVFLMVPLGGLVFAFFQFGLHKEPLRALGFATACYMAFQVVKMLKIQLSWKVRDPKTYGRWAIVTGCTSGLGQCFAHVLASKGMDIVLISRNPNKLEAEAKAIKEKYPDVTCKIMAYDFSDFDGAPKFYADLEKLVKDELPALGGLGVLVNNVGVGNELPYTLCDVDPKLESDMCRINCEGTVKMTRAVLPTLIAKKKGAIINISSASGTHATPMLTVYSATKAFINQFSHSVAWEAKEHGVDILGVHPYYVAGTGLYSAKKASLNAPAPKRIIDDTLGALGNTLIGYPYYFHAVMGWGFKNLDPMPTGARMLKMMKANAKRAAARSKKE